MDFVKAHGTGNDFVLLPDFTDGLELTETLTRALCAPHTGLGADGVIRMGAARNDGDHVFMDYRNADGSIAEMCGNGVRCVAKYLADRGIVTDDVIRVDTRAGTKHVRVVDHAPDGRVQTVSVDMGVPVPGKVDWSIDHVAPGEEAGPAAGAGPAGDPHALPTLRLTTVSMGNPHAVCFTEDVDAWPLEQMARHLNDHPEFPEGVNAEVVTVLSRTRIRGRIYERGVGETLASGTGASAMAVAAVVRELVEPRVDVVLPGGTLDVDWSGERVIVTGPAIEVAYGRLDDAWLLLTT